MHRIYYCSAPEMLDLIFMVQSFYPALCIGWHLEPISPHVTRLLLRVHEIQGELVDVPSIQAQICNDIGLLLIMRQYFGAKWALNCRFN